MDWNLHSASADWLRPAVSMVGAYLIGCFTSGYYLVRAWTGKDIREIGSGSTGARNVGRVVGKPGFVLTVIGDLAKGALAVWLARVFSHDEFSAALAVPSVVAGHLWPVQLKFHGGKGIATSFSALLVFDFRLALTMLVLFAVLFVFARKTLLPAMFAFVCLPAVCWFFIRDNFTIAVTAALSVAILFAHRRNLGEEFSALKSEPPKL
ncbi:MAG TPA: glycerol-3-phosphate acyltransferase [Candidatus Acidoferrales bacterium]|jgi:glycerol-3-phosphate acyltransferase PlsY|nr:glycerol-3-phosphate acyltransferase [Candidatus Acidoferrales bacterium]